MPVRRRRRRRRLFGLRVPARMAPPAERARVEFVAGAPHRRARLRATPAGPAGLRPNACLGRPARGGGGGGDPAPRLGPRKPPPHLQSNRLSRAGRRHVPGRAGASSPRHRFARARARACTHARARSLSAARCRVPGRRRRAPKCPVGRPALLHGSGSCRGLRKGPERPRTGAVEEIAPLHRADLFGGESVRGGRGGDASAPGAPWTPRGILVPGIRSPPAIVSRGSGIASREIDPVLSIHVPATDNLRGINLPPQLCSTEHGDIVTRLAQLVTSWSNRFFRPLIRPAPIQARQSLRSLSVPVAEHERTYGWIRPTR